MLNDAGSGLEIAAVSRFTPTGVRNHAGGELRVVRHAIDPLGEQDSAWTEPGHLGLGPRDAFCAALVAVDYTATANEAIDPPHSALPDLITRVRAYQADVHTTADQLRAWRV